MSDKVYSQYLKYEAAEAERLTDQARLLERCIGYLLHPSITATLPSSPSIADVATGPGVKVISLSEILPPTSRLYGFDIAPSNFPPADTLPANVKLVCADAKQPFPEEYHGAFDVVTIRYFTAALQPEDWAPVTRNLLQLLKPGGWIQWTEPDVYQIMSPVLRGDLSIPAPASAQLSGFFDEVVHSVWGPSSKAIPERLRQAGFEGVMCERVGTDRRPEDRLDWSLTTHRGLRSVAMTMDEKKGESGMGEKEMLKLLDQMREEITSGAVYYRFDVWVFLGRKPAGAG